MMDVLLHSQCLLAAVIFLCPGDVVGRLTAAPPTCPGGNFTFRCNVAGDMSGFTTWRVGSNTSDECILPHRSNTSLICGPGGAFTATSGAEFGTSATLFTSTLSGTAISILNGTLVECFGPANDVDPRNMVGNSTLQILGPPSVPTLSCVALSRDVSGAVNVTVSWTLSGGDSADFYLINITTNAPQTPYGGLLNITTGSVTQHELTGFMTGYEYNITVRGVTANCGGLVGRESEPLTITPQVPITPMSDVCAVYDIDETLYIIESTWNEVDNVTISEDCVNGQDIRANYKLTYATDSGTLNTTCVVNGTECCNGTCHHELQSNTADSRCQPPVSQFSGEGVTVSVIARNIVGRSNSAVSESIRGRNIDLMVHTDTNNISSVLVECTLNQEAYTCTIDYGTDPSYTNLVYRDTSYTPGRMATITLSQELRGDTTYYYIVSAERNSQCVRLLGNIQAVRHAGCNVTDLGITTQSGTMDSRCTDIGFLSGSSTSGGVVCYNRSTEGSMAVYYCNDDFILMGNKARVCQSDGNWNSSTPQCNPEEADQIGNILGGVFGAVVGGYLIFIIIILIIVIALWLREKAKRKQKAKQEPPVKYIPKEQYEMYAKSPPTATEWTPLHFAVREGYEHTVKALVSKGADVNIKDITEGEERGSAAGEVQVELRGQGAGSEGLRHEDHQITDQVLHNAARQGDVEAVKRFANEANVNLKDDSGCTPLHFAAREGYVGIVRWLVGKGADIKIQDSDGRTPLHMAVEGSHEDTVDHLVKQGADINSKDNNEITPLHMAARRGCVETVRYVVGKGADINIKDKDGWTALHIAAREGRENTVKCLINNGANINIQDNVGLTPLHMAAEEGHVKTVESLVEKQAAINMEDNNGWTALHFTAKKGRESTAKFLVVQGADISIKNSEGWTPLHIAAREGYVNTLKSLVGKKADIKIKSDNGRTPLHMAAEGSHKDTVDYLVKQGADINSKDTAGITPLHIAASRGFMETVKSLVDQGADITIENDNGVTALAMAASKDHDEIVQYLRAHMNIKDNEESTPWMQQLT